MIEMSDEQKVQHLLKPRRKVMINYPDSIYEVGSTINFPTKETWFSGELDWVSEMCGKDGIKAQRSIKYFDACPEIFQPLPWYAEREVEMMPEYLIILPNNLKQKTGMVFKVYKYKKNGEHPIAYSTEISGDIIPLSFCKPATAAEYQQYLSQVDYLI